MPSNATDSDALLALRRSWKFASVCQFLFTFDEVLQLDGFQTQRLESALQWNQMSYISWLFKVLLQFLTQSKTITQENWADAFRFQWSLRVIPAVQPLLGTEEEPIAWESLDILEKLENPERLRRLVESEEETISWRVNPAGWDREGNTYWLFDDNRMWIQRAPPKAASKARSKPPAKKLKTTKKASKPIPRPRSAGRRSSRLSGAHTGDMEPTPVENPKQEIKAEDVFGSDSELSQPPEEPSEWIEFETICITKQEWLAFCERFATSRHPDERSLYNYISKEVLPKILEVIQTEEKKAAMEAALSNRKRSSRIAMRDSEREQREREEMELREQRARAEAALQAERERVAREEAEAAARRTREDRMRERAERLLIRERMLAKREEWRRSEEAQVKGPDSVGPSPMPEGPPPALQQERPESNGNTTQTSSDTDKQPAMNRLQGTEGLPDVAAPSTNTPPPGVMAPASVPLHVSTPLAAQGSMPHTAMVPPSIPTAASSFASPLSPARPYPYAPTSPQNKSPRGSFPLRTQLLRSPLSRATDPMDAPTHISLGNSVLDKDASAARREPSAMPPPS
ncbi:DNA-directed RNA polymerase [Malassezia equina]|uniref:DNA-directed RNA polymerase n=1 Tax=Malassezia equina TaxID=1381935 RepID=A0AAF0EDF0_9BASI|nr:DNA-directed RNA polymerase [Malassezia equina]